MGRRDEFEDDGRTVADMSDLAGIGLFGRHSAAWQRVSKGDRRDSGRDEGSTEGSLTGRRCLLPGRNGYGIFLWHWAQPS